MGLPINDRDIRLQATSPRLEVHSTNTIQILTTGSTFALTGSGYQPSSITITPLLTGILSGISNLTWSISPTLIPGTDYSIDSNKVITLQATTNTVNVPITFTASLTFLGNTYTRSIVINSLEESVTIYLENESRQIPCDEEGDPKTGTFPVTAQLSVLRGTTALSSPNVYFALLENNSLTSPTISNSGVISVAGITANIGYAVFRAVVKIKSFTNCTITAASSIITLASHGFSNGNPIVLTSLNGGEGFSNNTIYYVVNAQSNSFQLSTTVGGSAITISTNGTATVNSGKSFDKKLILTKTIDGTIGVSPPVITISGEQVFITGEDKIAPEPATITFTTTIAQLTTPTYKWYIDDVEQIGAISSSFTLNAFSPSATSKQIKVVATDSVVATRTAEDWIDVFSLKSGSDSIAGVLSPANGVVAYDNLGSLKASTPLPLSATFVVARGAQVLAFPDLVFGKVSDQNITSSINITTGAVSISAVSGTTGPFIGTYVAGIKGIPFGGNLAGTSTVPKGFTQTLISPNRLYAPDLATNAYSSDFPNSVIPSGTIIAIGGTDNLNVFGGTFSGSKLLITTAASDAQGYVQVANVDGSALTFNPVTLGSSSQLTFFVTKYKITRTFTVIRVQDGDNGIGNPGANGLESLTAYRIRAQTDAALTTAPANTTGRTAPTDWSLNPGSPTVGQVVWYSFGRYNSNGSAVDGIPSGETKWSVPIAASVFQDIKSDNWVAGGGLSGGTPTGGTFTSTTGYYLNKTEGSLYATNVYLRGEFETGSAGTRITINDNANNLLQVFNESDQRIAQIGGTALGTLQSVIILEPRIENLGEGTFAAEGGIDITMPDYDSAQNGIITRAIDIDYGKGLLYLGSYQKGADVVTGLGINTENIGQATLGSTTIVRLGHREPTTGAVGGLFKYFYDTNDPRAEVRLATDGATPHAVYIVSGTLRYGTVTIQDPSGVDSASTKFLSANGSWSVPGGGSGTGTLPSGGTSAQFLRGDGVWSNTLTGNLLVTGDITAFSSSDPKLKHNITKIDNALDKLLQISGYYFTWNQDYLNNLELPSNLIKTDDIGLLATEVQKILPQAVITRSDGILAVSYVKLIPLIIEALAELKTRINKE